MAYETLLQERRRALHARIVEALEALAGDAGGRAGRTPGPPCPAGRGVGQGPGVLPAGGGEGHGAVGPPRGRGVLRAGAQCPAASAGDSATRVEQAIDLRLALRSALLPSGDSGRILAYLREAETLAAALDDPRRLGQVSRFLSLHFYYRGAYDQAIAAAQRALALATASGEVVLQALANHYLGRAYQAQGDYRRAIDCLGQTVASLDGARRHERFGQLILPAVHSRAYLACVPCRAGHVRRGQCPRGRRAADCRGGCSPRQPHVGLLRDRSAVPPPRRPAQGPPLLERAMGICQDADLPLCFPRMAAALGAAYTLAGRVADAVPLLTQALEQATAMETSAHAGAL